jgi:hypothetical protein
MDRNRLCDPIFWRAFRSNNDRNWTWCPYIQCSAYISYCTTPTIQANPPHLPFSSPEPWLDVTSLEMCTLVPVLDACHVSSLFLQTWEESLLCTVHLLFCQPAGEQVLLRLLGESLKCIDRSSPSAVEVPPLAIAGCRALIQGQVLRCQEHL